MSKLNPKSLECIFLGYSRVSKRFRCYCPSLRQYLVSTDSRVQKGYRCSCPSLRKYLIYDDVTFLKNTSFSQDPIHTSQGPDDDLLVYTHASPAPTYVPPLTKPPITQVYARHLHPPVSSPPPATSTSDPVLSDDLPIALYKGKCQCTHPISSFCSYKPFVIPFLFVYCILGLYFVA